MLHALLNVKIESAMEKIFDMIVERKLTLADDANGQTFEITVQIGRPYLLDTGIDGVCPVRIKGLFDEERAIFGIDEMSALKLAINFVDAYLSNLPATKKVYWPDGELYFDESASSEPGLEM